MGPSGKRLTISWRSSEAKGLPGFPRWGFNQLPAKVSFAPRENLALSLTYQQSEEDEWLNWIEGTLGTYTRKQRVTVADLNWFQGQRHESRLKVSWWRLQRETTAYLGDGSGAERGRHRSVAL